ncbi:MAG: YicC family protein [Candidatus Eisenbacteria bacterium]|nr:YicC family protein [Candidatus Eisenbacteria bacterium]
MLRSMTGYGCSERATDGSRVRVEMRSVNQRFLDVQIRGPRIITQVEDRIRSLLEARIERGRVSVYVEWSGTGPAEGPTVNREVAARLVTELRSVADELSLPGEVSIDLLARFQQVFEQGETTPAADEVWDALEPGISESLESMIAMREEEGRRLGEELAGRLDLIEKHVSVMTAAAPDAAQALKNRLRERITELMGETPPVDETRLAQELAQAAERSDYTEEVVRLNAHVEHARRCLEEDAPVGKRLNFLVQEMHREANTIGSKTSDVDVAGSALSLKEEIEKLREQVQNVE